MTMGAIHKSEPEMDYDKEMSKKHKAHRKEVEKMTDPKEKLEKSILYNASHRDEHQDALIKSKNKLKILKKRNKASYKMGR